MKKFFNRVYQSVGVTGSIVAMTALHPKPNEVLCYTNILFQDEDSDITSLEIGIRTPSGFHKMFYNAAPGVGIPIHATDTPVVVIHPNYLEARIVGTTNADVLRLYLNGYTEFLKEPT